MTDERREAGVPDDFDVFYGHGPGTRLVGSYLWPHRFLAEADWQNLYTHTEFCGSTEINGVRVYVTRNGGLFAEPPSRLPERVPGTASTIKDVQAKKRFESEASRAFNVFLCELALEGIVSEPISPAYISSASRVDDHALITRAKGGREIYTSRVMGPHDALRNGTWGGWPMPADEGGIVLDRLLWCERSRQILKLGALLPEVVAGAYSAASRGQEIEAAIDSWVVVEVLLSHWWEAYRKALESADRRKRLEDYTAAEQIEVLLTAGEFEPEFAEMLQAARKIRNNVAHEAKLQPDDSAKCLNAMTTALARFLGASVAPAQRDVGVNW